MQQLEGRPRYAAERQVHYEPCPEGRGASALRPRVVYQVWDRAAGRFVPGEFAAASVAAAWAEQLARRSDVAT